MKLIVCLLALIAVSFGQDYSCKIQIQNSILLRGEVFGSSYSQDKTNPYYYTFVGNYTHLVNDTGDPSTYMALTNETIFENNGITGEQIFKGFIWSLQVGSTVYTMTRIGGVDQPCHKMEGVKFQHISDIFDKLKIVYPIPGVPIDPNFPYICQGAVSEDMIMSIEYEHRGDSKDKLVYINTLSKSSHTMNRVESALPLPTNDTHLFDNICNHTEILTDDILMDNHGYARRSMHKFH